MIQVVQYLFLNLHICIHYMEEIIPESKDLV
jgi:hypothetical protein